MHSFKLSIKWNSRYYIRKGALRCTPSNFQYNETLKILYKERCTKVHSFKLSKNSIQWNSLDIIQGKVHSFKLSIKWTLKIVLKERCTKVHSFKLSIKWNSQDIIQGKVHKGALLQTFNKMKFSRYYYSRMKLKLSQDIQGKVHTFKLSIKWNSK